MSKSIGWGKCSIIIRDIDTDDSSWIKLPTPKEDSTTLETTTGDKLTADIEGGDYEDAKYEASEYELSYTIRRNTERKKPMEDVNGVVENHYEVFVQPENSNVPGCYIKNTVVSLEEAFDTTDGGTLTYTHTALLPEDGTEQKVLWVTCNVDLSSADEGTEYAESDITLTDFDA